VLGLHFFSPANVMRLLEVVRGAKTDKSVLATAMALAKKIKKVAVMVGVCFGFAGNRMGNPVYPSDDRTLAATLDELHGHYLDRYSAESFVRILPKGQLPNISQVTGSNFCDIGLAVDDRTGRVIAVAVIDNLVKGAAGQALQNMNLMLGLPEQTGLMVAPGFP
jgi:N-acetyl-gamma-glutamylphosphate reductase